MQTQRLENQKVWYKEVLGWMDKHTGKTEPAADAKKVTVTRD
ncbi:hypothetical protein [Gallaecimonas pentaromativorans]